MKVGIWLDDIRLPDEVPSIIDKWILTKNDDEFKKAFVDYYKEFRTLPVLVSLDHDLSSEHMEFYLSNPKGTPIPYETFKEKTGIHSLKFVMEVCRVNNIEPNFKVFIHSNNPVGSFNMQVLANDYKKKAGLPQDAVQHKWKYKDVDVNNENYTKYLEIKEKYTNFEEK